MAAAYAGPTLRDQRSPKHLNSHSQHVGSFGKRNALKIITSSLLQDGTKTFPRAVRFSYPLEFLFFSKNTFSITIQMVCSLIPLRSSTVQQFIFVAQVGLWTLNPEADTVSTSQQSIKIKSVMTVITIRGQKDRSKSIGLPSLDGAAPNCSSARLLFQF